MIEQADALPGREQAVSVPKQHYVSGASLEEPFPDGTETVQLGMGCFWGAERKFWALPGVYSTAVGYAGGFTPNPSYEEVCSGLTGHTEAVLVVFEPAVISLDKILKVFWESHNPTQGMRQGNDSGTQYRSAIYVSDSQQMAIANESLSSYRQALLGASYPEVTTELRQDVHFYYAEEYHQQYLAKNPAGYCGMGGTGVICPV
ncbi:MAG: peptide-methionine (S)-S-oxide reductase MsrA [Pseudomonadales bacterium]